MTEMGLADLRNYSDLIDDRPEKFEPGQVNYIIAPAGSAMRCGGCYHLYRRATDGFTVCEILRSDEIDRDGIDPAFRCNWFTVDGDVFPLMEAE